MKMRKNKNVIFNILRLEEIFLWWNIKTVYIYMEAKI